MSILEGILEGIDVHTSEFDFAVTDGQRYKGTLSKEMREHEYVVPIRGSARIIETVVYHDISGKEQFKYELVEWAHFSTDHDR